ncbi:hypothetical protein FQN54_003161 [Arachnomyces sp. PD_36]|nr:hypothetical protein FQN54_003161 [Arachnomyces sp. PD_36]
MATIDLSDPSFRPQRLHKTGFFKLPRELRDIIYAYVLVEPYYLDRRHSASCEESDPGCDKPETPPFIAPCYSRCNRRRGLGLLLVNRLIHDEATPIFWGRNVHCFCSPGEFRENVSSRLRKRYRDYIQHVHIVFPYQPHTPHSGTEALWKAIFLCKNLRTLELGPDLLEFVYHLYYSNLRSSLPHLESLAMIKLQKYECQHLPTLEKYRIWVKTTKKIPLDQSESQLHEAVRDFKTNHVVHVNHHVEKYFLHSKPDWPASRYPQFDPHLKDNNSVQTVTLRDGSVVDLPIYGLPSSPATRMQRFRQKYFEQNRRKVAGLPSLGEAKIAERIKDAREVKKERLNIEEEREREREREEKKMEQEKFREEQEIAESKTKKNQRAHKQRKVRKAEKIKQEERKRVPKPS